MEPQAPSTPGSELRSKLEKVGVPEIYLDCSIETWRGTAPTIPDKAFLTGPVGTGKTHMAVAKVRELLGRDERVTFRPARDLVAEIKRAIFDEGYSEAKVIKHFAEHPNLVIDDLGVGQITDYIRGMIYDIVDYKYCNGLNLIVTSNLSPDEMAHRIDDRITSRICGMCEVIRFTGADKRVEGKQGATRGRYDR